MKRRKGKSRILYPPRPCLIIMASVCVLNRDYIYKQLKENNAIKKEEM